MSERFNKALRGAKSIIAIPASYDLDGETLNTLRNGKPAGNVTGEIEVFSPPPSIYNTPSFTLTNLGIGGPIAPGTRALQVTIRAAPTSGHFVFAGFGEDVPDAQSKISMTGTIFGYPVRFPVVRANASNAMVYLPMMSAIVPVPKGLTTPHYVLGENGTPTGQVWVSEL